MSKKKLKKIGKLKEEASTLLQLLRRLEASDDNGYCSCVSCGTTKHYKEMQGGHFIPRGNSATLLLSANIHPQCQGCNAFGMKYGDAEKKYTLWMIDNHGRDMVDYLVRKKGEVFKWCRPDIEGAIDKYKERIKVEENRISC